LFDLKGSTVNREEKNKVGPTTILKDVNFNNDEKQIYLQESEIENVNEIVSKDANFLNSLKIMDYSLFLIKLECEDFENSLFPNEYIKINLDLNLGVMKV